MSSALVELAHRGQRGGQLLRLGPERRPHPVLDVEHVLLDVDEHQPGQRDRLVEHLLVLGRHQLAVLGGDPVPLAQHLGGRPVDRLAGLAAGAGTRAPRPAGCPGPAPRSGARGSRRGGPGSVLTMNHGSDGALPVGHPLRAGLALAQRGEQGLRVVVAADPLAQAEPLRLLGQPLQLVVGPVQLDVQAADHARDGLVGDVRERALAQPEERQVGGVADVEQLEVVLVGLVHRGHEVVEVADHPEAGRVSDVVVHRGLGLQVGQRLEAQRPDLGQLRVDLRPSTAP